ncbi:glycosyltransferase [Candidatus Pelagibacter sp.]|jgi:GT2 family glycosyltransferase|nr:glycosyltransferase [Candidatus Pelagibacter sp.]
MNLHSDELTITIILFEEKKSLVFECLENLKNFKIIIIDNAGNSLLKLEIEDKYKIHKYILNKRNYGVSKAFNQAIDLCETTYILNINADCFIKSESILKLLNTHKKYKNCFLTAPTFYDKNLNLSYNAGSFLDLKNKNEVLDLKGDICADMVLGSAILYKKEDILKIGSFDENFFVYFLDYDLCKKIKKNNMSVIQVFEAKAIHTHGQSKVKNFLKRIYNRHYNFTHDELYYLYKMKSHHQKFNNLKKKINIYFFKSAFNLLIFRLEKSIEYFATIRAYLSFKKFISKK